MYDVKLSKDSRIGWFFLALLCIAAVLLLTPSSSIGQTSSFTEKDVTYHRAFLPHPDNPEERVELYWTQPDGEERYPAILFIHGFQRHERPGGLAYIQYGRLAHIRNRGYVAAAVSQPGFGESNSKPDYCGPIAQKAVLAAIRFLRKQPFVNPDKIGLMGYSRGAIVASMVAAQDTRLAAAALAAGVYDLKSRYPTGIRGLDANIEREAGTSDEAFRARSALHHVDRIKSPILLLHGAEDDRSPVEQAEEFAEKLNSLGVPVVLKIFHRHGHRLPIRKIYGSWVYPFFEKHLKSN